MNLQFVKGEPLFARINKIENKYDYLSEDIDTEVIIVGGGVTGAILGYYLSRNNIDCVILEKNIAGYGSTCITTALLQYELDSTVRDLEQYTQYEKIIQSYKLGVKALDEIDEFIKKYGNNCNYTKRDTLLYTARESDIGEIREEYEIRKENGFDVRFIEEKDNPFSFELKAGLYGVNAGAELDPYKFTHELIKAGLENSLRIYENTEVVKITYGEDKVEAETKYGFKVKGKVIVAATGYNTSLFSDRQFGTTTLTFNVATKPLENINGYYKNVLIRDNKDPYNYFRTTYDNRIIGGGEDIDFLTNVNNEKVCVEKYKSLESTIKRMFNEILDIEFDYEYCGAFTSTQDNVGFIGKDPDKPRLWYDLGYGANGILFAILGGMMLSKLYNGEVDENLSLFNPARFDN
ncbi:MAG: FAD-dependent oxidoreductase [Clostridium sp.]|nr:FAD-dependent oxidoreductase [Clostridium sp.]